MLLSKLPQSFIAANTMNETFNPDICSVMLC